MMDRQDDRPGDTREPLGDLVNRHSSRLTESDTRLLDVLMRDPVRAAMETGTTVSSRAGVHPASALRLARRLGFKGYPEFRGFLQSSLLEGGGDFENPAARMAARLVRAEQGGVLSSILDSEIAALNQVRNGVSDGDIRGFSESLRDGRRIFIFGRGHSAALSSLIALRLVRSGYEAVDLSSRMHQLDEALATIGPGDVAWLFAFRRVAPAVSEVLRIAASRGATTLALTDLACARMDPLPDRRIAVSRGETGQSQSLVVPMTIANAIVLDLAAIDGGRSLRALASFKDFRSSCGLP